MCLESGFRVHKCHPRFATNSDEVTFFLCSVLQKERFNVVQWPVFHCQGKSHAQVETGRYAHVRDEERCVSRPGECDEQW